MIQYLLISLGLGGLGFLYYAYKLGQEVLNINLYEMYAKRFERQLQPDLSNRTYVIENIHNLVEKLDSYPKDTFIQRNYPFRVHKKKLIRLLQDMITSIESYELLHT